MILSTLSLHILTNSFLAFGTLSQWLKRRLSIWGIFLFLTVASAWFNKFLAIEGFMVIAILFFLSWMGLKGKKPLKWFWLTLLAGFGIWTSLHFAPGIFNWHVVYPTRLSPDSYPYTLWINLDKALVGFIVLTCGPTLLKPGKEWFSLWKEMGWWVFVTIGTLIGIAYLIGFMRFDPKLAPYWWLWMINNLLFVCVVEELLFRHVIQKALLQHYWGNFTGGRYFAIMLAALLFGMYHYRHGYLMMGLATLAGIFYGLIYHRTDKIEASIMLHFLVNSVHFLAFSYPALS